ncbi:MAG TPA: hypothetical protein VMR23_14460 [Candidatus Limnocylindria bacterium]|nr:hypothetical protein [Candidatus Limnocylindria bacterium]
MPDNLARVGPQPLKPCRCGRSVEAAPGSEPWPGLDCDCCFAPIPGAVRSTDKLLCRACLP